MEQTGISDLTSCWVLTEGMAGTENQCLGIADALGLTYEIKKIKLREPWKSLSPYIGFEKNKSFSPKLTPPWPDILIASGRKSIAASKYIKKASKNHSFTVQIQDPRINPKYFDLIAVPEHDPLRGENVIVTKASPNRITKTLLQKAKIDFPEFKKLKSPKVAVLIGGSSKAYDLTENITKKLVYELKNIDASLMITCSRRTGELNRKTLQESLDCGSNYFWNGKGANPYIALLAWADYILVTADSASMISESCTTGKPVYMIDLKGGSKRMAKFHNNLIKYGILKKFTGRFYNYDYEPLNDAQIVAQEIKKRFKDFTNHA